MSTQYFTYILAGSAATSSRSRGSSNFPIGALAMLLLLMSVKCWVREVGLFAVATHIVASVHIVLAATFTAQNFVALGLHLIHERLATIWVIMHLIVAVCIGFIGLEGRPWLVLHLVYLLGLGKLRLAVGLLLGHLLELGLVRLLLLVGVGILVH
jgi:hypothetical protein